MQELNKVRLVQIGAEGVRPLADAAILLAEDGQTVKLGITTLQSDIEVSQDSDDELTEGMQRQVRIDEMIAQYRPTMGEDVMRSWASELVSLLAARR
ncbi:hypothetical protein [Streptomyces sp. BH105]|uniref:hypothetical protein n=1 Tax=Streptomyces sp. BH105 TaxID=3410408 RepID=UPI003CF52D7B